jgi:hypothetical protein
MPMYTFRLSMPPDPDPADLPNDEVARAEAINLAGGILQGIRHTDVDGSLDLQVVDAAGREVIKISIRVNVP